ncbi:MAG: shikimate kinase [Mogibacterium sp.]|nr:shikimate kinase [Mogibacterium sp.]
MKDNLILIGMPAAGKSTIGVILAKMMGMDFVDSDLVIQHRAGKKLNEIIASEGLEGFLRFEEEVCLSLEAENAVIATGGSVVYGERAMEHFRRMGRILYLEVSFEELLRRLDDVEQRGVVLRPGQTIRGLYEERVPLYERYADLTIPEDGLGIEQIVRRIIGL